MIGAAALYGNHRKLLTRMAAAMTLEAETSDALAVQRTLPDDDRRKRRAEGRRA